MNCAARIEHQIRDRRIRRLEVAMGLDAGQPLPIPYEPSLTVAKDARQTIEQSVDETQEKD